MAKYTVLSDIGKAILGLLRDKLVPDTVDKAESIGLCDPKDRGGYIVGIHPYDIREDLNGKSADPNPLPDGGVPGAPALIELYYVISVSSKAEIEAKALDEAKIIGRVIQVFKDNPTIPATYMPNNMGAPVESVPITMLPLNMEEKVKVWTMFGESYKLSVFYLVGPVAIDSEIVHKPKKRVESVHLGSGHFVRREKLDFETRIKEEDIDDEYTQRPDEDEDESEDEDTFGEDGKSSDNEFSEDSEETSEDGAGESLGESGEEASEDSAGESLGESGEEASEDSADESLGESGEEASEDGAGESLGEKGEEASEEGADESLGESGEEASEDSAGESLGEEGGEAPPEAPTEEVNFQSAD